MNVIETTYGFSEIDEYVKAVLVKHHGRLSEYYTGQQLSPGGIEWAGLLSLFVTAGGRLTVSSMGPDEVFTIEADDPKKYARSLSNAISSHLKLLSDGM